MKKNTDTLGQDLMSAPDLDQFLAQHDGTFQNCSVAEYIDALFQVKSVTKSNLAKRSAMSEVYLHQVFSGRRNPSRNRLLCLCFGLSASLEETQTLLKQCGYAQLYPKNRRDAIIIYGILHNEDLFDINDKLYTENEESLF